MGGEEEDKQFEPTQKKLDDARRKGDIARSTDLNTAATYAGLVLAGMALGAESLQSAGETLMQMLAQPEVLSAEIFNGGMQTGIGQMIWSTIRPVSVWFWAPACAVLLVILAQRSFVVAPSRLQPKLNRLSLLANAKNKFGRQGLFEFAKAFLKLSVLSLVLGIFLVQITPQIVESVYYDPAPGTANMMQLALRFLVLILVVASLVGGVDYMFQNAEHLRKLRMSRQELTDETKQAEGDPHVKQQRRARAQEIAMNKMLADVPKADVIIVNPTHYAVALKWSRTKSSAPECVAKGVDEIAARIREIAQESGVPIHRDPPTARALHASIDIGEQIWPEHYAAVAAAIRFADKMAQKARARG